MTTLTAATPNMGGSLSGGARMRPVTAPASGGVGGADILRIIRQRLAMILTLWFFSIGATAGLTFLVQKYYPTYRALAYVQVESIDPVNVMQPLSPVKMTEEEMDRAVQDQAMLVKSPAVLQRAIEDSAIKQTQWYRDADNRARDGDIGLIDILDDTVGAAPIRASSFLQVTAKAKYQNEVATIVNTVLDKYYNYVQETQKSEIRRLGDQLKKEYEDAKKLFDEKQKQLQDFRVTHGVIGRGDEPNEDLLTLKAISTELRLDALARKSQWETLRDARPENMPVTAELQSILAADPVIARLESQIQETETILRQAEQRYGANHRTVRDARMTLKGLTEPLNEAYAEKTLKYHNEQIEQAHRNYLESQQALIDVQEQLDQAEASQRDMDRKMAEYMHLLEDREVHRLKWESLGQQRDFIMMTLRAERQLRIDVIKAQPPKQRANPRWSIWIPAGTILGLAMSLGLAVLLDLADKSVRTPRDIARHSAVPVLGTIPNSDDDEIEIGRVETASIDAPHSVVAEAFRQLRANLFFSAPAEQQGVLMVTSPSGGNGKTTVATNLAISIALSGRRVLLVDANLRRPALPRIFPQVRSEGLSNILIGQSRLADLATSTNVPGLDVLGSGPTPPNPAELLGSSYLRDLVVDARSRYDQVIFDGPPVLLVSDAVVLAGAVDGVLIVCQYKHTSRGALQRARTQLDAINSRVFGAVLNMVETRAGGYFRQHYREFYEYHENGDDVGPRPPRLEAAVPVASAVPLAAASATPRLDHDQQSDIEPEPDDEVIDLAQAGRDQMRQIDEIGDVRIDEALALGEGLDQPASVTTEPLDRESAAAFENELDDAVGLDKDTLSMMDRVADSLEEPDSLADSDDLDWADGDGDEEEPGKA